MDLLKNMQIATLILLVIIIILFVIFMLVIKDTLSYVLSTIMNKLVSFEVKHDYTNVYTNLKNEINLQLDMILADIQRIKNEVLISDNSDKSNKMKHNKEMKILQEDIKRIEKTTNKILKCMKKNEKEFNIPEMTGLTQVSDEEREFFRTIGGVNDKKPK